MATHTDLIRSPLVRRRIPMLAAASSEVGGVQIQNRGTLGGNIANASPAGDTLPALAAADASVVLTSAAGTRRSRFPRSTRLPRHGSAAGRADCWCRGSTLARPQAFRKVGTRAARRSRRS
jgi:CO/xanthine dehydrogenase FAD-binding subunit